MSDSNKDYIKPQMITDMFHNEFSKWTLRINNEDLYLEWAMLLIKSKQRMIIVGALTILLNDSYFDYYWRKTSSIDFWIRIVCNALIFIFIFFIYIYNRDIFKVK